MYSQSGGKGNGHAWLSDSTNTGAISYLVVQTYEYAYHRNFRTVHQRIATLHVGMFALLPSDRFLRALTATPPPTRSQDGRTLTLDAAQFQIFNELRGKLQDILRAVKAARKKAEPRRVMLTRWTRSDFIWDYVASTNWPSERKFTANPNKIAVC